uniref:sulfatase-like hydrolase/transferase n=1 Tax=Algisphaera agarilytica TaxID=1385975 RepID=UPI001C87ABEF
MPDHATSNPPPNILWILTDDQRPDSLARYNRATLGTDESTLGHVMSPHTDRLAAEGVLFTRAFCNSPMCTPSRGSMHTGRYPFRTGHYRFTGTHQQPDFVRPTVSQVLRATAPPSSARPAGASANTSTPTRTSATTSSTTPSSSRPTLNNTASATSSTAPANTISSTASSAPSSRKKPSNTPAAKPTPTTPSDATSRSPKTNWRSKRRSNGSSTSCVPTPGSTRGSSSVA